MNVTRGLLRAWVTTTVAWVAYWVWAWSLLPDLVCLYRGPAADGCHGYGHDPLTLGSWDNIAIRILGVPVAVFVAGLATAWVIRGFRAAGNGATMRTVTVAICAALVGAFIGAWIVYLSKGNDRLAAQVPELGRRLNLCLVEKIEAWDQCRKDKEDLEAKVRGARTGGTP